MREQASPPHSTANTCPWGAARASSTLTLPVPAPTSHNTSAGPTASLARAAARTSCLVIGTSPRRNAPSGRPGQRCANWGAASVSRTERDGKARPASSSAVPMVIFSSGLDRFSPTVTDRFPKPASVSRRQISPGPSSPPVRKNAGFPRLTAPTTLQSVPWADTSAQSCQGRPSRAERSCTLETPGSTRAGMSRSFNRGKSPRAPE